MSHEAFFFFVLVAFCCSVCKEGIYSVVCVAGKDKVLSKTHSKDSQQIYIITTKNCAV